MDQRSDDIRQTIEDTRASLDDKLDSLETKARETFDLKHQVDERPWLMLGAAVAAGYLVGNLGGSDTPEQRWQGQPVTTTDYNQHAQYTQPPTNNEPSMGSKVKSGADSFLSQFDDEIDMLKSAAIATLTTMVRDAIKDYAPALGRQLDNTARTRGREVSSSPSATGAGLSGASQYYDVRESPTTTNHEAIPETTYQQSNMADRDAEHATPYYPPGSTGNRERSVGEDTKR